MKNLRKIVVFVLVVLVVFYVSTNQNDSKFAILCIFCFVLLLLSLVLFEEVLLKVKGILMGKIVFTRGLPYCVASLPILWDLLKEPFAPNYIGQIVAYLLGLFLLILNYGTSVPVPPRNT